MPSPSELIPLVFVWKPGLSHSLFNCVALAKVTSQATMQMNEMIEQGSLRK
jgi:hypothetical protein